MKILVLGASGMLGSTVLRVMSERSDWIVFGALRSDQSDLHRLAPSATLISDIHVDQPDSLLSALEISRPDAVINCVGLVKQLSIANDPLEAIPINSLLPYQLLKMCKSINARLIHISTDCVFSGAKGKYHEDDLPDATDLYGLTKRLGEIDDPQAITIRTSIIGRELKGHHSLLNWFLAQTGEVQGYAKAIFSGLPAVELAHVIRDVVLPNPHLNGLYHVASDPISKLELLRLISQVYHKKIHIVPDSDVIIDRSLNADRFYKATGYKPPSWPELVDQMYKFK